MTKTNLLAILIVVAFALIIMICIFSFEPRVTSNDYYMNEQFIVRNYWVDGNNRHHILISPLSDTTVCRDFKLPDDKSRQYNTNEIVHFDFILRKHFFKHVNYIQSHVQH